MSPASEVPLSAVQHPLWHGPRAAQVAALRLTGRLDDDRLAAAVAEVFDAFDVLRAGFAERNGSTEHGGRDGSTEHGGRDGSAERAGRDGEPVMVLGGGQPTLACAATGGTDRDLVRILLADRDRPMDPLRDPLVRLHLLRRGDDELVLGLVADPLVLDLRSAYLVLGAVVQAYLSRFRAAQYPPLEQAMPAITAGCRAPSTARRAWWSRRLQEWSAFKYHHYGENEPLTTPIAGPATDLVASRVRPAADRRPSTRRLGLDAERWQRLAAAADSSGNNGWLAVIALLAWWLRDKGGRGGAAVFTGTLDLRDYLGLGPVIGPLTDRIAFEVDLGGADRLTFAELVHRAHAGLLDSVVHYVPYRELVAIGAAAGTPPPPLPDRPWEIATHYCRLPPTSAYTRGESSLARHGLSVELFCESELAAGTLTAPVDVHLTESGAGVALVVNFDAAVVSGTDIDAMLQRIDEVSRQPCLPTITPGNTR